MAPGWAATAKRMARTLTLIALLATGLLALKPAAAGPTGPILTSGTQAGTQAAVGTLRQGKPDAYSLSGELPCALPRKQNKRLRPPNVRFSAEKDGPSPDANAHASHVALAGGRPKLGRFVPIVDRPAVPPRGYRFLSRAPPGVASC